MKVSLFPGKIGIDFANHVDTVFREKIPNVKRLVIDLRGNPGGGHWRAPSDELSHSFQGSGRLQSLDRPMRSAAMTRQAFPKLDHIPKSKLEIPLLALKVFREEVRRARNCGAG